jgi:hypothetical protein
MTEDISQVNDWVKAVQKEVKFLVENETFQRGEKPNAGDEVIPAIFVYKAKITSKGYLDKLKARCVARGDLQEKSDPNDLWAPCVFAWTFKVFVSQAAKQKRIIKQLDFVGTNGIQRHPNSVRATIIRRGNNNLILIGWSIHENDTPFAFQENHNTAWLYQDMHGPTNPFHFKQSIEAGNVIAVSDGSFLTEQQAGSAGWYIEDRHELQQLRGSIPSLVPRIPNAHIEANYQDSSGLSHISIGSVLSIMCNTAIYQ